jgi:hypothetical protein
MPSAPLIVTWPGGIGNPLNETIPTSGGSWKRKGRKTRKATRKARKTRKSRRGMSACTGARRCWSRKRRGGA